VPAQERDAVAARPQIQENTPMTDWNVYFLKRPKTERGYNLLFDYQGIFKAETPAAAVQMALGREEYLESVPLGAFSAAKYCAVKAHVREEWEFYNVTHERPGS